ncbi:MAG: aminotransferase class I/II-fold pyridoxal phosphate-dependent enzyme [Chitinophagaceae bacterium]|nr:aminotransferase class I/II-fold pyridoxal phosphate-dependent enzyme [Chitinophagaceae bacterium]
MSPFNRRRFLRNTGLSILPTLLPAVSAIANEKSQLPQAAKVIRFFADSAPLEVGEYAELLREINLKHSIVKDRYGAGGVVAELENKFLQVTGKERAIFLPSGTMANQFALAEHSGSNTKIFVQDTSHVYRDEADAAQSVFQKRLMPLAKNETAFTAAQLKDAIDHLSEEEVFASGVGAVSIENPVRRTSGRMISIDEIKKISAYCKEKNIKLHLDGARIYIASAWSGISIKEYASHFDSIYISLYKYLGAPSGAILCGDKNLIDQIPHLMKIHGGSMYGNWTNAALALHHMETAEESWKRIKQRADLLFPELNKISGIQINALSSGTNIYSLVLANTINGGRFAEKLNRDFNIRIGRINSNTTEMTVNETLLYQNIDFVTNAFRAAVMG